METIQISISDPHYRAALEQLLGGSGSCKLIESETPDFGASGVVVMDDRVLGRLVPPLPSPERVVLITHNVQHAYPIGDTFVVLFLGRQLGTFKKNDLSETQLMRLMAGKTDTLAELRAVKP